MRCDRSGATPLEIFIALAPGATPPAALVADHDAGASSGGAAAPRTLTVDPGVLHGIGDPGIDDYDCDSFGEVFYDDWLDTFDDVTDVAQAGAMHFFSLTQWDFYPGYHVYKGINTNQVTYLGACNGDSDTPLTVEVHRRFKIVTPPTVTYTWVEVAGAGLGLNQKYTFYSGVPASYRGRLRGPGIADPVDHLSVGVAYTKSPPLGIAF